MCLLYGASLGWGALSATQQQRAACAFFAGKQQVLYV